MDESKISPQQQREHGDPHELSNPVPWYLLILVGLMCAFGMLYIANSHINQPSEWGDGRIQEELSVAGGTASSNGKLDGAAIYAARCAACHQANGSGVQGVFPPLAGSEWVVGSDKALAVIVLHGVNGPLTVKGNVYNGTMPTFKDQLNDAEMAAVLSHLRTSWGNTGGAIDADLVAQVRKETADRKDPLKGDADLMALK